MSTTLQEKVAGMTPQQAEKLSRELQGLENSWKHPEVTMKGFFPVLHWLINAIKLEGSIAEQIHLCPPCRKGNHKLHSYDYVDHDSNVWLCRCAECK